MTKPAEPAPAFQRAGETLVAHEPAPIAAPAAGATLVDQASPAPATVASAATEKELDLVMALTPEYIQSLTSLLDKDSVQDDEIKAVLMRVQNNLPPRNLSTVFECDPPTPPMASYGGMSIQKEASTASSRKSKSKACAGSSGKSSKSSALQGAVAKRKSGGGASTTSSAANSKSVAESEGSKPFSMPSWLVQSPRLLAYQPPWERNGSNWNSVDPPSNKNTEPVSAMTAVKQRMAGATGSKKGTPNQSPSVTPRSMGSATPGWRATQSPRAANIGSPRDSNKKPTAAVVVVPTVASKVVSPVQVSVYDVPAPAPAPAPAAAPAVVTTIRLADLVNLTAAEAPAPESPAATAVVKSPTAADSRVELFIAPASEVSTSPSRRSLNIQSPRSNSCRNSHQAPSQLLKAALDPLCNQLPTDPMYEATLMQVETLLAQHN